MIEPIIQRIKRILNSLHVDLIKVTCQVHITQPVKFVTHIGQIRLKLSKVKVYLGHFSVLSCPNILAYIEVQCPTKHSRKSKAMNVKPGGCSTDDTNSINY